MRRFVLLSVFALSIVGGQALTEKEVDDCINNCGPRSTDEVFANYCGVVNDKRRTLDEEDLECLSSCWISYKLAYPGTCAEDKTLVLDPPYNEACHQCMEDLDFDQLCPNIRTPNFRVISRNNVDCQTVCDVPETLVHAYGFVETICVEPSLSALQ